jgi:hypothetical protein
MIFNRDILFIHVPKTGGMSASRYLLNVLPRPVYYSLPTLDESIADPGIIQVPGIRHESLAEAADIVAKYGRSLDSFRAIIAVIRNPYAIDVSRYAYLQKGYSWDKGFNQELALDENFETFAIRSFDHAGHSRPIQSYLELDGHMPPNLRVLHNENLAVELADVLREVGVESAGELPWDNQSEHGDFMRYYTRLAEEAVARRYAWIFERGFCSRVDRSAFEFSQDMPRSGPDVPLSGPIRQTGPSGGLWHDGWAGENLRFDVRVNEPVNRLTLEGSVSHHAGEVFAACIRVAGIDHHRQMRAPGELKWQVPVAAKADEWVRVRVTPGSTFRPVDLGVNADSRSLSFLLKRVAFEQSAKEESRVGGFAHRPAEAAK